MQTGLSTTDEGPNVEGPSFPVSFTMGQLSTIWRAKWAAAFTTPAQPTFETHENAAFRPSTLFRRPPISSANNAVRAINRAEGCVHVRAAIPKDTPRKAIVAHRLEIECRGQVSLIRAVCLGDFGAGMIRDEG